MVDHENIDEAIDDLELLIRRGRLDELRGAAESFAGLLEAHFSLEEMSPMFTSIAAENAAVGAKVDLLLNEHGEMRAEVHALLASDDLAARLMALTKKLDAHEKVELALLEHAFSRVARE